MIRLIDWLILLKHLVTLTIGCGGVFYLFVWANRLVGSNSNLNVIFGVFLFVVAVFLAIVILSWIRDFWRFLCKLFRKMFNLYEKKY